MKLNKDYCVIHTKVGEWELLHKSEDGDVVYHTNIFFHCHNVGEALEMCADHIDIHKQMWKKNGCVELDSPVYIKCK